MTTRVATRDFLEVEDGSLKSVDLSKLFFPDDKAESHEGRIVTGQPEPSHPDPLPKLARWPATPAGPFTLTQAETSAIVRLPILSIQSPPKRNARPLPKLQLPPTTTFSVQRSRDSSALGGLLTEGLQKRERAQIELPFGMPRFVSAATLKGMFGADDGETLFRKVGKRWEVCPDSFEIDLKDRTRVFRLGQVQIFS